MDFPRDWPLQCLDDLKSTADNAIAIGPFGSRMKSDCYVSNGVRVIRGNNISDTKELTGDFVYVTESKADELRSSNVSPDDLVFPHRGAIGQVGIVPDNGSDRYILSSSLMKLTCNRSLVEPLFVFYLFRSAWGRNELLRHASIVGTPGIGTPLATLKAIKIPVPPLPIQRRIAEILGRLDDKIEVNRRINRTLEAMAQALYRHWFVDFGPFQEGEFVESAVGLAPRGWEVKALDEIATYTNGLALQKYPPKGDAYLPVIKIAEMRRGVTESSDKASPDIDARYIVQDGDVLFSWSGTLLVTLWCGGPGALNQHLFKVTSAQYPKWLYYWATKHHLDEFKQIAANKVTTMGHIQRHHLAEALVAIPPAQEFKRIDRTMSLLLDKIIECELESRQLAATRDYLLPRLLAGEVEV